MKKRQMLIVIVLAVILAALCGCQSKLTIGYNPESGEVIYERIGDIDVADCVVARDPNGVIQISFTKAKSVDATAQMVAKSLENVALELSKKIPSVKID